MKRIFKRIALYCTILISIGGAVALFPSKAMACWGPISAPPTITCNEDLLKEQYFRVNDSIFKVPIGYISETEAKILSDTEKPLHTYHYKNRGRNVEFNVMWDNLSPTCKYAQENELLNDFSNLHSFYHYPLHPRIYSSCHGHAKKGPYIPSFVKNAVIIALRAQPTHFEATPLELFKKREKWDMEKYRSVADAVNDINELAHFRTYLVDGQSKAVIRNESNWIGWRPKKYIYFQSNESFAHHPASLECYYNKEREMLVSIPNTLSEYEVCYLKFIHKDTQILIKTTLNGSVIPYDTKELTILPIIEKISNFVQNFAISPSIPIKVRRPFREPPPMFPLD